MEFPACNPVLFPVQSLYPAPQDVPSPSVPICNDSLTQFEAAEARARAPEATSALHTFNKKVARDAHQNTVDSSMQLASPVHGVPGEILAEVFQWCHAFHAQEPPHLSHLGPFGETPLVRAYGAVCSRWRCVMMQTPSLWASVELYYRSQRAELSAEHCERMRVWLLRSRQHPLSVRIIGRQYIRPGEIFVECLKLLLCHCHRWRSLHVESQFMPAPQDFLDVWRHALTSVPPLDSCSVILGFFRERFLEGHLSFLLPCESVTNLELGHWTFYTGEELLNCVKACPSLEFLIVDNSCYDGTWHKDDILSGPPFVHWKLRTLAIRGGPSIIRRHPRHSRPTLLSGLTAPALISLELSCRNWDVDRENTRDFIRRSPSLQHLHIEEECDIVCGFHDAGAPVQTLRLSPRRKGPARLKEAILGLAESAEILPNVRCLQIDIDLDKANYSAVEESDYYCLREAILALCQKRLDPRGGSLQQIRLNVLVCEIIFNGRDRLISQAQTLVDLKDVGVEGLDVVTGYTW